MISYGNRLVVSVQQRFAPCRRNDNVLAQKLSLNSISQPFSDWSPSMPNLKHEGDELDYDPTIAARTGAEAMKFALQQISVEANIPLDQLAVEGLALVDENICIPLEIVQWIQKETAE